jgi:lipase maturation factor 1
VLENEASATPDRGRSFGRSAWLFGRLLGAVFLIAFLSFHVQLAGLVGSHGIAPAADYLGALRDSGYGFWDVPSLVWLAHDVDASLSLLCFIGELASLALLIGAFSGPSAWIASLSYLSLGNVSVPFMSFQWDALLVESGFLAGLMLAWHPIDRPSRAIEPLPIARWAVYLLLFRLMFLSGCVKLASGDETWVSLRALDYHYYTQPLPNPFSWLAHQLPGFVQRISTFLVIASELLAPFAIFFGRVGRRIAFALLAGLMLVIALTGNYGFFNLLAIALCLPLLDDAALERVSPAKARAFVRSSEDTRPRWRTILRYAFAIPTALAIFLGAEQIVVSLGGGRAMPDFAFAPLAAANRWNVVNGYGLFAVMTTSRREIRIEGSLDGIEWREYRFAHKPSDPSEIPGWSAPHMPRLDWQMWFAALGEARDSPWLFRFMQRLLDAQPEVLALLESDPFHGARPRYLRATIHDYEFGDFGLLFTEGKWWRMRDLGAYTRTFRR